MVRTIDKAERRRVLAEAVWAIIRRDGFEAASVRAVADEASLSPGSVRHFFASQDELHVFAMEALVERIGSRVRAVLDAGRDADGPGAGWTAPAARRAVAAVCCELLPLTAQRHALYLAHLQFLTRSTVHEALRPMAVAMTEQTTALVTHLVQSLVDTGAARPDLDVASAARGLTLLLDGLTLRLLTAPEDLTPAAAAGLVDARLAEWGLAAGELS